MSRPLFVSRKIGKFSSNSFPRTDLFFLLVAFLFFFNASLSSAFEIQTIETDIRGDFMLSPSKIEISLKPGESTVRELVLRNRQSTPLFFKISVEDFSSSDDLNTVVSLLGDEIGPYSLKEFIRPEIGSFTLKSKEQITVLVEISIPEDTTPGGRYGSVLFQTENAAPEGIGNVNTARLGALFFVRVEGEINEDGELSTFQLVGEKRLLTRNRELIFEFLYENRGSVHVAPYGIIEVRNMAGQSVHGIEIDPYFVLPNSTRKNTALWKPERLFGRYVAEISLNRGYENRIDRKEISFWVVPWKKIILGGGSIIFLIVFIWYIMKKKRGERARDR